jgi:hypothetical protein
LLVGSPGNSVGAVLTYLGDGSLFSPDPAALLFCPDCPDSILPPYFGKTLGVLADAAAGATARAWIAAPGFMVDGAGDVGRAFTFGLTPEGTFALPGLTIPSPAGGETQRFGGGGATVGDTNGDGYRDAILAAPGYPLGCCPADGQGRAWWYRGGTEGIAATPDLVIATPFAPDTSAFGTVIAAAVY